LQPAFENYGWQSGQFPVSESLARELLCLPIRPDMQRFEVAYVTERIKKFVANRANAA
jgi:dTDP-4-amino-4,6-dideoxygalactose transaminase